MHEQVFARPTRPTRPSRGKQLDLQKGDALIVVDLQRDFLPGGKLGIATANEIIGPVNAYLAAFNDRELPIFLSRDWHPEDHCSFKAAGGPWPPHCVQDTEGAAWPKDLIVPESAHVISKGTERGVEAYSAFAGTSLLALLKAANVRRVFVAGLATDYCVHATVLAARSHDFDVVLLADAIRGVNLNEGDEARAITEMLEVGATLFERSHTPASHAHPAEPGRRVVNPVGSYGFAIDLTLPFDQVVGRVTQALHYEGFGVISDIDVSALMHKRLGVRMPAYKILGACNPPLAHRALQAEPSVGLLLPCNVVIREEDEGRVRVEFMDPNLLGELVDDEEVVATAHLVRRKLRDAMRWI